MDNFSYNRLIIEGNDQEVEQFVTSFKQDSFAAHVRIPDPAWKDAWKFAMEGNPHDALLPGFSELMQTHWGVNARLIETKESIEKMPHSKAIPDSFFPTFSDFPSVHPPQSKVHAPR